MLIGSCQATFSCTNQQLIGPLTAFPPFSQPPAEQVKTAFNQTSGEIVEALIQLNPGTKMI